MDEYIISYRVYGPSDITSHGSIGNASVNPKSDKSEVNATLDFYVQANDKQEATQNQDELRNEAQHITNVLSFIVRDGLVLGKPYPPSQADSDFRTQTDYTTVIDNLILEIGNRMLKDVSEKLSDDNMTERAFTWYNLGLSTETPEDRFVAFWTGLEASVKPMKDLSEEQNEAYKQAKEEVENVLRSHGSLLDRVRSSLGHIQEESTVDALSRVLKSEANVSDERIDELGELPPVIALGRNERSGRKLSG